MTTFENICPSDIVFESDVPIHSSNFSEVYLVHVRGQQCIMKIVSTPSKSSQETLLKPEQQKGRGPRMHYDHPTRELDIHVAEVKAYARLHDCCIADRGIIPKYLGSLPKFDPGIYLQNPSFFIDDAFPPSAMFLEYIPGLKPFTIEEYTPERARSFLSAMEAIHDALVIHDDIRSRNIMIVEGEPERIVVLDFDRAEVYDRSTITDKEKEYINIESQIVNEVVEALRDDHKSGVLSRCTHSYYGFHDG